MADDILTAMHYAREHMAVLLLLAMTVAVPIGCDREKPAPQPPAPTPPKPTPVAVAPPFDSAAPVPPATQPVAPAESVQAVFVINEQPILFPPAKLVLEKSDGKTRAMLFSIDPPAAVRQRDIGNSFYFKFDLDIAALSELPGHRIEYRNSTSGDRDDDATTGIFIAGGKQVLQPLQAVVDFRSSDTGETLVLVDGTFELRDDRSPDAQAIVVSVRARLTPVVKEQAR